MSIFDRKQESTEFQKGKLEKLKETLEYLIQLREYYREQNRHEEATRLGQSISGLRFVIRKEEVEK